MISNINTQFLSLFSSSESNQLENDRLFRRLVLTVAVILIPYVFMYFYYGSEFNAIADLVGIFILTPIILLLQNRKRGDAARIIFILSCNLYIYLSSLGTQHQVDAEIFCLPCTLLAPLLFDSRRTFWLLFGVFVAFVNWLLIRWGAFIQLPAELLPDLMPYQLIRDLNFAGAFLVTGLFIAMFSRSTRSHQIRSVTTINKARDAVEEVLQEKIAVQKSLIMAHERIVYTAKMASLGEMSAGVAHEINNPLAIIIGKIEKLTRLSQTSEAAFDLIRVDLGDIKQTAFRISDIVKALLKFARNSGHEVFQKVQLKNLICGVLNLCQERFKSNSIALNINMIPNVFFHGQEQQISQVIINLLNNAFDAVVGTLKPWVDIDFMVPSEDCLQIIVTDSGLGIPEGIAGKIMEPFFTTKDVGKAAGLGLSISQGIVQNHGGSLSLDRYSPHTCFVLKLPLLPGAHEA